jgi:hypothetical protein
MNIVFGTKRLGKTDGAYESFQKHADKAVVTLEGDRGKGRTRRILFNRTAMDQMGLEKGAVQEIVFGTIDADENGNRAILIANANNLANIDDLTTYKTSKNAVAFENSKEKGKAISSAALTKDMITFLDLDVDSEVEYALQSFDVDGGLPSDTFKFVSISTLVNVPMENSAVEETTNDEDWNSKPEEAINDEGSFLTRTEAEPVRE